MLYREKIVKRYEQLFDPTLLEMNRSIDRHLIIPPPHGVRVVKHVGRRLI